MHKVRKWILVTLTAAVFTGIMGCESSNPENTSVASGETQEEKQTIGISFPTTELAYREKMLEIVKNTYQQSIYLAKISIIHGGTAYIIDSVENIPFQLNCLVIVSAFLLLLLNICVFFIYTYTQKIHHNQLQQRSFLHGF